MGTQGSAWFQEAKFGMFIHWGLYALLAGEYKGVKTAHIAEWILHDLQIPKGEYQALAQSFNPKGFDAPAIAALAKKAGMRYLCFTSKHHDGFSMFDTKADPYNSVQAAPFARDVCKELQKACEQQGLKLCFYYSQAQDWHHEGGLESGTRETNPRFREYFDTKVKPQITELLTNYGDIGMLWLDTPMSMGREEALELKTLIKGLQPDCLISGRIGHGLGDYLTTGDNFMPAQPPGFPFEVPATLNHTWGYNRFDQDWKSPEKIIRDLVSVVSRGGNYLLNIGPDGEGRVPGESVRVLEEIGRFMAENGESVYGTQPVPPYPYALPWLGMTARKGLLYLHVYEPREQVYFINIANKLKRATLLATGQELDFAQGKTCEDDGYWRITLPKGAWKGPDTVIRCEMEEDEAVFEPLKL